MRRFASYTSTHPLSVPCIKLPFVHFSTNNTRDSHIFLEKDKRSHQKNNLFLNLSRVTNKRLRSVLKRTFKKIKAGTMRLKRGKIDWMVGCDNDRTSRSEKNSLEAIDPQCHVHDTLVRIIYREREIVFFFSEFPGRCACRDQYGRQSRATTSFRECVVRSEAPNGIVFIGRMLRFK